MTVLEANNDVTIAMSDPKGMIDSETFVSDVDISDFHFDASTEFYFNNLFKAFPTLKSTVKDLPETANPVLVKYKFKCP